MTEPTTQKIEELTRQAIALKQEREQLRNEARNWVEKRNALHEQSKALRAEAKSLREKRDATNQKVQELKRAREQSRTQQKEKHAQVFKAKEKIRGLMEKAPSRRPLGDIQKEIEALDWKIQTNPLSLNEEKTIVEQVKVLEKQRTVQKKLEKIRNATAAIQSEEKELATKAKSSHDELQGLAEQSQKLHEQMIELQNKTESLKIEADAAHQQYLEFSREANETHQKYVSLLQQAESLKKEIQKKNEEQQTKRKHELLAQATQKAKEKMTRGERLTWDEFKLVTEEEAETES